MKTLENMKKELEAKIEKIGFAEMMIDRIKSDYYWSFDTIDESTGEIRQKTVEELDRWKHEDEEHSEEYRRKEFLEDVINMIEKMVK